MYTKRAHREGFPARSVYKLEEIDRRVRLFRKGQRVLDLGAAPGSWTLYAAQKVGPQGSVLSIDLNPLAGISLPNVKALQLDLLTADPATLDTQFDVVLSDMAPHTSGRKQQDQYRSYELFQVAWLWAERMLAQKGAFVGKIFQGPEFEEARNALRGSFETVRILKPEASRAESYEIFLVGLSKKT